MKEYIGTRQIQASYMTRLEYNDFRGWVLPNNEDGDDCGYMVRDIISEHVSWLPENEFHNIYKSSGDLTFGDAIYLMKKGYKLSRKGWNGKSMYIQYFSPVAHGLEEFTFLDKEPTGTTKPLLPFLMMKTADDMFVPWLASHSDMLSSDWCIYE
jgi:hypothetical protein